MIIFANVSFIINHMTEDFTNIMLLKNDYIWPSHSEFKA